MTTGVPVGRLLVGDDERRRREAAEDAPAQAGEALRTAFVLSSGHVLTTWHNVATAGGTGIWFRAPLGRGRSTRFVYVPLELVAKDEDLDVAVLGLDETRLAGRAGQELRDMWTRLQDSAMAPVDDVRDRDPVKVIGYPTGEQVSYPTTLAGDVVEARLRFRHAVALKIQLPEVQASTPVRPRGLSGAPVVLARGANGSGPAEDCRSLVVGVVRAAPREPGAEGTPGGTVVATALRDLRHLTAIDHALTRSPAAPRRTPRGWLVGVAAAVVVLGSGTWWITTSHQPPPESSGIVAPSVSPSPSVTGSRSVSQTSSASDSRLLAQSPLPQGASYAAVSGQDLRLTCGTNQGNDIVRQVEFTIPTDGFTTFDAEVQAPPVWGPDKGVQVTVNTETRYNAAARKQEVGSAAPRGGQTSSLHGDISGATRVWVQYYCSIHDATFTLKRPRISR